MCSTLCSRGNSGVLRPLLTQPPGKASWRWLTPGSCLQRGMGILQLGKEEGKDVNRGNCLWRHNPEEVLGCQVRRGKRQMRLEESSGARRRVLRAKPRSLDFMLQSMAGKGFEAGHKVIQLIGLRPGPSDSEHELFLYTRAASLFRSRQHFKEVWRIVKWLLQAKAKAKIKYSSFMLLLPHVLWES